MTSPRLPAAFFPLCLAAMLCACHHAPTAGQDPRAAAEAFIASVESGDTRTAYDGAAFGFQASQSYEAFVSNSQNLGIIHGKPPVWNHEEVDEKEARLDATLENKFGFPLDVKLTLTPDGGEWKIFSLDTDAGLYDSTEIDPFTLVGKGTGFNDVYHQPIPKQDKITALVQGTMRLFNAAILKNDFHEFYANISDQWKNGQRDTGQAAAGVTVEMLQGHFKGFVDKKIDLSPLLGMTPVYDTAPIINPDGLLQVDGHYDLPAYRVTFSFEYAYELPVWKLFGINVNLTKPPAAAEITRRISIAQALP